MASSPTDRAVTPSPTTFALQEATACWNQAYEALARGDLDRVTALLEIAADHLHHAGDSTADSAEEASCRREAAAARGRLEHGVRAGMQGLQEELATTRRGSKVLRGYGESVRGVRDNVRLDV